VLRSIFRTNQTSDHFPRAVSHREGGLASQRTIRDPARRTLAQLASGLPVSATAQRTPGTVRVGGYLMTARPEL
jgi:hypothetical protein